MILSSPHLYFDILRMKKKLRESRFRKCKYWDFPGSPVVKNTLCNAGDLGSIPSQETKSPHVAEQLSLWATMTEPMHHKWKVWAPQWKIPLATTKTWHSQTNNVFKYFWLVNGRANVATCLILKPIYFFYCMMLL